MDLIQSALQRGQKALSEYNSKKLLAGYGIPVTREALVQSATEAVLAASTIRYPVVLKACAPELMHKSESGGVEIGIRNETDLRQAYDRIVGSAKIALEGILVQEMIPGQRELVLGLNRDPQFGPCVMLGLGGVLTEVLQDTAFRVAPFDPIEARDMTTELRAKTIFSSFRGQAPADTETICRALTALGQIGLDHPAVAEIDINPMIIDPGGRVVAVDALVVLGG